MTTLTIMRHLPREVDPLVYNMSHEDPGDVTYSAIGGLSEQIRELREVSTITVVMKGKKWFKTVPQHDLETVSIIIFNSI